jgi:hypothetical protein
MEGYDVITSDESKVGHVAGESNGCAIVENGLIRHTRHVVPLEFLNLDEAAETYRTSLSKQMIHDAPEADADGNYDAVEVSTYYGLEQPATPDSTAEFHAAGDETPFVDTRPDPKELAGGFEQERMVRGGL